MSKPILCLDFDGVLHSYTSGWNGAHDIPDPPVHGAKNFILSAMEYFQIRILSSRSHQSGGIEAMRAWCTKHFGKDITKQLEFVLNKPPAAVTLDDRAFQFNGVWPDVQELLDFKPWYKDSDIARLAKHSKFIEQHAEEVAVEMTKIITEHAREMIKQTADNSKRLTTLAEAMTATTFTEVQQDMLHINSLKQAFAKVDITSIINHKDNYIRITGTDKALNELLFEIDALANAVKA